MFRSFKIIVFAGCLFPLYPSVSSVTILKTTHSSALVQVDFSAPTGARIAYGPTSNLEYVTTWYEASLSRHVIWMTGMNPSQQYSFRVEEGTEAQTASVSQLYGVTTRSAPSAEPIPPQLPKRFDTRVPPQTGVVRAVNSNCSDAQTGLQALIFAAQPGDTLVIDPRTTCTGPFVLPAKAPGPSADRMWITIRTAVSDTNFVPDGFRVQPTDTALMPTVTVPNKSQPAFSLSAGGNHYRLIGINISTPSSSGEHLTGFDIPDDNVSDVILDRLVIQSPGLSRMKWATNMNGSRIAIINSYIETTYPGYEVNPGDQFGPNSYCMVMHSARGPVRFSNNACRSIGIGVFGTDDAAHKSIEDVEITQNTFSYDDKYRKGSPASNGIYYAHRNLIEFKKGKRILIDGNIFENYWGDNLRGGQVLVFTPRNGDTQIPLEECLGISDLTITSNIFRNLPGGIDIRGHNPDSGWAAPVNTPLTERVRIGNNLLYRINGFTNISQESYYDAFHAPFLNLFGGGSDYIIENNSYIDPQGSGPAFVRAYGEALGRLTMRNNLLWLNTDWYNGGAATYPEGTILPNRSPKKAFWEIDVKYTLDGWAMGGQPGGYTFRNNVLPVGTQTRFDATYWVSRVPAGNFLPGEGVAALSKIGFVDSAAGNYRLGPLSIYKNAGTDGRSPGVQQDVLEAKSGAVKNIGITGTSITFTAALGSSCVLTFNQGGGLKSIPSAATSPTGPDGFRTFSINTAVATAGGVRSGDLRCKSITPVSW
jgi:hypothetical protein